VISALLAEKGVAVYERPMEGQAGLFRLYAGAEYGLSRLVGALGETFEDGKVLSMAKRVTLEVDRGSLRAGEL